MNECELKEKLLLYYYKELPKEEISSFEEHILKCKYCQQRLQILNQLSNVYKRINVIEPKESTIEAIYKKAEEYKLKQNWLKKELNKILNKKIPFVYVSLLAIIFFIGSFFIYINIFLNRKLTSHKNIVKVEKVFNIDEGILSLEKNINQMEEEIALNTPINVDELNKRIEEEINNLKI